MRSPSIETTPMPALRLQARLEAHARWRQWQARTFLCALAGTLVVAVAFVLWRRLQADGRALLAVLEAQPVLVAIASVALGWNLTRTARRRAQKTFATSWLATTPLDAREILAATRRQVALRVLPVLAASLAVPLAAMAASGADARRSLALIGGGFLVGALTGWRSGTRTNVSVSAASPRLSAARATTSNAAGVAALARWPFARLLADANPRQHAQLVAGVLLMLPMGIPPSTALLIVLLAASLIAAHALLQALLATIPDAAGWLRATPMPLPVLARTLCLRSGGALLAAIVLATSLLFALGASRSAILAFGAVASAWCVTAIGNALASRHRPERARGERIALALAVLALLGSAWWLLPIALPMLWWRDAWRARRA
ncbi:hypothetical protein [Dokdonella sp.]|uniref:hypothetical protein n=1 Tax=Dokdonella sp. TaxID=2291710 RepID=UPI001B0F52B2|nr:hypothetical protein [Dokdonella sp.]MBO9661629.1 hypothetical protein [Dokdonella sp.]